MVKAITKISETPEHIFPKNHSDIELSDLKQEDTDEPHINTQITTIQHKHVFSYDEMCFEFSSPCS